MDQEWDKLTTYAKHYILHKLTYFWRCERKRVLNANVQKFLSVCLSSICYCRPVYTKKKISMPDEMGRDGGVVTYLLLFLLITVSNTTPQFLHRYIALSDTILGVGSYQHLPLVQSTEIGTLVCKDFNGLVVFKNLWISNRLLVTVFWIWWISISQLENSSVNCPQQRTEFSRDWLI